MTEFGRYLKQCPPALKDKTRTLSLLKDALKNDLPKFRVLQAAYELGILEAIQRSNPISTDDRLKITTGLVSQYAMLENAAKNAIDYWQDSVDADILYRALNDADECRESRINSAESTARPAIPIKPQQNPAENLLKIESISQDSIRMGIRLQWEKQSEASVYKGYKQDKIEMRGDRAEMSDFPLYLNTVAGGLDRRDQTIGGFSFVVKIYAVPVVEIIG